MKGEKAHQKLRECIANIRSVILNGYFIPDAKKTVRDLFAQLYNPELPLLEVKDVLSRISNRLPKVFLDDLTKELTAYLYIQYNPNFL